MRTTLFFALTLIPAFLFAQSSRWRGTNQDGCYPDTNLLDEWPADGLPIKTTYSGIGEGYGSPAITEEAIFVAGMHDSTGYVHCYSHEGKILWKTPYGDEFTFHFPGSRATPTIDKNRLYCTGSFGDAFCLDTKTGNVIWKVDLFEKYKANPIKWGYTESPLLYQDKVILTPGGPDASIVALNKMDGSVIWEMELDSGYNAYCSPKLIKLQDQTFGIVNLNNYLVIFDPENGTVLYKTDIQNKHDNNTMEPLYLDGKILHTAGYGIGATFYKLGDQNNLDTIYHNNDFDCKLSGMIQIGDLIYGTSDKKKQWDVFNWRTGEVIFNTRDIKPGSLIMADKKFYIFTDNGEIALAKPTPSGIELISKFNSPAYPAKLAFAHPVINNGDLFIRFNDSIWRYPLKSSD